MEQPVHRGAQLSAQSRTPSVDLVRLLQLLAEALPSGDAAPGQLKLWPFFNYDAKRKRIRVNTRAVLSRLYANPGFKASFAGLEGKQFLRHAVAPPKSMTAHMGGRLVEEKAAHLTDAVAALSKRVTEALDALLSAHALSLDTLTQSDAKASLTSLAAHTGGKLLADAYPARIVPLTFKEPERSAQDRERDVARLISAEEEVESGDWLEKLSNAVRRHLQHRDEDEETIEAALESLRHEHERLGSQIERFLNFLDDEALSRVRLAVGFSIMDAIAQAATNRKDHEFVLLTDYVARVHRVFEMFASADGDSLLVRASASYGSAADVNVSNFLRQAGFYVSLSVWPEWAMQMFEDRREREGTGGFSVAREVSYRFRINGDNPTEGKRSFEVRLDNLRDILTPADPLDGAPNPYLLQRALAELVFLSAVVPDAGDLGQDAAELARAAAAAVSGEGKLAAVRLLKQLEARAKSMALIAGALVELLRTKGQALFKNARKEALEQYVCVQRGIVDWGRLVSASGASRDLLVRPADSAAAETPEWFKHLVISPNPDVANLLFSVRVRTLLHERALAATDRPSADIKVMRLPSGRALHVAIRPFTISRTEGVPPKWEPVHVGETPWLTEAGIDVEYDAQALTRRDARSGVSPEEQQQLHAAGGAAFAVLVYAAVWHIVDRLTEQGKSTEPLTALLMRFQEKGREADITDGDSVVYAACQAVELALSRDTRTFMQGLVAGSNNPSFQSRGAFAALQSAFPLAISMPVAPAVGKFGLVSYATRPVDKHPSFSGADGWLFIAKSYVAEACEAPFQGLVLREVCTKTHVVESRDAFSDPTLILEEIAHLAEAGCEHVMLLWHHYGNRKLGRAADRHSPHTRPEFLDRAAARFPNLTIYPMRRDVFPATRLRKRLPGEGGFEVLRVGDHGRSNENSPQDLRRGLVPFYTFATLGVVGSNDAQRPQSGFCTYFLEEEHRVQHREWMARAQLHLVDPDGRSEVRPALIAMFRGLHFLEAERPLIGGNYLPVLEPHGWVWPTSVGGMGEVEVIKPRRKGPVRLSYPALLTHISDVLHRGR